MFSVSVHMRINRAERRAIFTESVLRREVAGCMGIVKRLSIVALLRLIGTETLRFSFL